MKFLILALILLMPIAYGQSIGIIPRVNEIEVITNNPGITDIRLSQAAGYDEIITIKPRENYEWLTLRETSFVLSPGIRKVVEIDIHTVDNGRYEAKFDVCAAGGEAGTMTLVACTDHTLIVNSVTDPAIVTTVAVTAGSIIFVSGLGFMMFRNRKMKINKEKMILNRKFKVK